MRFLVSLLTLLIFTAAGLSSVAAGYFGTVLLERKTLETLSSGLIQEGLDWTRIKPDGLIVELSGVAETEAARLEALRIAGGLVDAERINDKIAVKDNTTTRIPEFSIEMLRGQGSVSLIGIIPKKQGKRAISSAIGSIPGETEVLDMLETADYPIPETWGAAMEFGLLALRTLPQSRISVSESEVTVAALTENPRQKEELREKLLKAAPAGVKLEMDISAPRPVISPFSLHVEISGSQVSLESCSADTEEARSLIVSALRQAGLDGLVACAIGLGAPDGKWGEAVAEAVRALGEMGAGTLTFTGADVMIVAGRKMPENEFGKMALDLESRLPEVFSLRAVLPPEMAAESTRRAAEFHAVLEPGRLEMRGAMKDARARRAATAFARAMFGPGEVADSTRIDPTAPDGWQTRVLTGLKALAMLHAGSVSIYEDRLEIAGSTRDPGGESGVKSILAEQLGGPENYSMEIRRVRVEAPKPKPLAAGACANSVNAVLAGRKIAFRPSSAKIEGEASEAVERLAEVMRECEHVRMEIGGHTDSQGSSGKNQALSQSRAEAVLDSLLAKGVLTTNLTTRGYGESRPIASNSTEEGREENRRIEFRLLTGDESQEGEDG